MIFKPERILKYKELCLKHFNQTISDEEAVEGLTHLVEAVSLVIPKDSNLITKVSIDEKSGEVLNVNR